jgi:hypothetical protein
MKLSVAVSFMCLASASAFAPNSVKSTVSGSLDSVDVVDIFHGVTNVATIAVDRLSDGPISLYSRSVLCRRNDPVEFNL